MSAFVSIAGNIGVGKTTFTQKVADHYGWTPIYESVIDNPYLSDFYADMERWSFNLQIYFLHHRFGGLLKLQTEAGIIQDRSIYEDVEIFAHNLHEMGNMSDRDWETYRALFANMTHFLRAPDLLIYLRASTHTLLSRIAQRNRDFEQDIDPDYLHLLNLSYEKWIKRNRSLKIYTIDTDDFNIHTDHEKFKEIVNEIEKRIA